MASARRTTGGGRPASPAPTRRASKKGTKATRRTTPAAKRGSRRAETTSGADVAAALRDLRTQLREATDQYLARVDGQLAATIRRLQDNGPGDRKLKLELRGLRKVKPEKGRLKDLAKIEGLAEKLQELLGKS